MLILVVVLRVLFVLSMTMANAGGTRLWVKCGISEPGIRKVKRGKENAERR